MNDSLFLAVPRDYGYNVYCSATCMLQDYIFDKPAEEWHNKESFLESAGIDITHKCCQICGGRLDNDW